MSVDILPTCINCKNLLTIFIYVRFCNEHISEERPEFIEGRPADIIFFGVRKEVVAWQRNERRRNKSVRLCKVCPP